MAGTYPDAPSRWMMCDADGTIGLELNITTGVVNAELSAAQMTDLHDIDDTNAVSLSTGEMVAYIFPELREIDGVYGQIDSTAGTNAVYTSPDTTNGFDGTWTARFSPWTPNDASVSPFYRDSIKSLALSSQRGIQWRRESGTNWLTYLQIYGEISSGETPDRLLWFDQPTALEFSLPIDYGDIPRGSAEDRLTYLRNNSGSLTANSVQVTAEALTGASGAWYTFSEGGAYQSTLSLASSIANGANSPNITIRRIIPDAETVGLHAGRAYANVGSWT